MKAIDTFCMLLGAASALLIALSMMYVCAEIVFGNDDFLPGPPKTMFIGLFGALSAMLTFAAAHLSKGEL